MKKILLLQAFAFLTMGLSLYSQERSYSQETSEVEKLLDRKDKIRELVKRVQQETLDDRYNIDPLDLALYGGKNELPELSSQLYQTYTQTEEYLKAEKSGLPEDELNAEKTPEYVAYENIENLIKKEEELIEHIKNFIKERNEVLKPYNRVLFRDFKGNYL